MTAVHDTLRQAIADALWNGRYAGKITADEASYDILAAVLADPHVRRAFAITEIWDAIVGAHNEATAKFRAAGEMT